MAPGSPDGHDRPPVADGGGRRPGVLCLLGNDDRSKDIQFRVAAAVADGGRVVVVSGDDSEQFVRRARAESALTDVEVESVDGPSSASRGWITSTVDERELSTIVDGRDGHSGFTDSRSLGVDSDCTLVTVGTAEGVDSVSSLLVPVAMGPHLDAVVDVSKTLAEATDSWLDLFHVVEDADAQSANVEALLSHCAERLGSFDQYDEWVFEAPDPAAAIADQSQYYDVTVLGATQTGELRRYVFGSTADEVREMAPNVVLTVDASDVAMSRVERWFGEGT
ncbi:universal stress protein [Haloprofundus halobius]|uniref:universal stress protein n=1 Tax=Haloprofundus halobius TaxID=2876194 RepID=UPI001CCE3C4F|nr:universal stress protein [Haloprofundus halobius]